LKVVESRKANSFVFFFTVINKVGINLYEIPGVYARSKKGSGCQNVLQGNYISRRWSISMHWQTVDERLASQENKL